MRIVDICRPIRLIYIYICIYDEVFFFLLFLFDIMINKKQQEKKEVKCCFLTFIF